MFIASLFVIAKTWKQLKCSAVGEWIIKLWFIQTIEYYSAKKKEMNYQAMQRHGQNLRTYYLVEEDNIEKAT